MPSSLTRFQAYGWRTLRSRLPGPAALAIGLLTGLVMWRSGWFALASATLVVMGFDPDRARLIASLVAAFASAALATFMTGRRRVPVLVSFLVLAGLFGRTFERETRQALAASGSDGRFDPFGWAMTLLAVVALALLIGWMAVVLSSSCRVWLLETAHLVAADVTDRAPHRRTLGRVVSLVAGVLVLAVALPTLGDMFNFSPDARMRTGTGAPIGLFSGPTPRPISAASSPSIAVGAAGLPASITDLVPALAGTALATGGALGEGRPWQSSLPTGAGRIEAYRLPAPWTGGTSTTIDVEIYLPPGYDVFGRDYPVTYELPWPLATWSGALQFPQMLDAMIDSGEIPPQLMVFVSDRGGPYPDSECADSFDGRERFDWFVSTTLPTWIDGHYRTIIGAGPRMLMGFSGGGFCATSVLLRHPDVFGQALAFDGYFVTAPADRQTLNAGLPFGNDPARMAAASPTLLATTISAELRGRIFIVLAGDPTSHFYGLQMQAFASTLDKARIAMGWVPSSLGHSWAAVRETVATGLELVALRQVGQGVLGP